MNEFLEGLLIASVSGAALAALLFLAKPFVKNKISHKSQYFCWYLVFIRMLLPFSFGGLFIGTLFPTQNLSVQSPANPVPSGNPSITSAVASSAGNVGVGSSVSQAQAGGIAQTVHSGGFFQNDWGLLLFALWLLGVFVLLGINLVGYMGYGRRSKSQD